MPLRRLVIMLMAVTGLVVVGCSSEGTSSESSPETTADSQSFDFGQPADSNDAARVIEIAADDNFTFDPATAKVEVGDVVTFRVTNIGKLPHELILGPEVVQEEHAKEMADMGDMEMDHGDPNAISVPAGDTADLTWKFTEAGKLLYGCHVQGHYEAGMVGDIEVVKPV